MAKRPVSAVGNRRPITEYAKMAAAMGGHMRYKVCRKRERERERERAHARALNALIAGRVKVNRKYDYATLPRVLHSLHGRRFGVF